MRKRQAKKIKKKQGKRETKKVFFGACPVPLVPGFMESFTKTVGCGVALVESEQSISGLK